MINPNLLSETLELLVFANKELAFQYKEKEKRAGELIVANKELAFQNIEKEKRAAELIVANKELAFQNIEKGKRAAELIIANKELALQNTKKEKKVSELIISTLVDITERRKNEEFIGHLAAIVESSDDAIISKSLDGIIKSWNKGSEKMFGYSAKEAIGSHITLIIPSEYIYEEKLIIERIRNNETIDHYETMRIKKSGNRFYVSLTVSPLKDRAGNIVGVSKIARDITYRKESEIKLIQSNEYLVFQNEEIRKRSEALIIADKELIFQNKEKMKRATDLLILSDDLKARHQELKEANDNILTLNHNLEKRVFERTAELEKLNHKLKDLNLSKDKFLSVISHDLRNPLGALLISSEVLIRKTEDNIFEEIQPLAKIINSTSCKIIHQLNELLNWAKCNKRKQL